MRRLRILQSAADDLVETLDFVSRQSGSLATGRRFVQALRMRCVELAGLPGTMGRPRPELRSDIRSVAFKGYVIFFRYSDGAFEVVNIIHGHRDIERLFDV